MADMEICPTKLTLLRHTPRRGTARGFLTFVCNITCRARTCDENDPTDMIWHDEEFIQIYTLKAAIQGYCLVATKDNKTFSFSLSLSVLAITFMISPDTFTS
jgi:hypothetical protein